MPEVRRILLETKQRVAASDPGLGRLRQALSATLSVGTAHLHRLGGTLTERAETGVGLPRRERAH